MSWVRSTSEFGEPLNNWYDSETGASTSVDPTAVSRKPWVYDGYQDPLSVALTGGGEQQAAQRAGLASDGLRSLLDTYAGTESKYDDALAALYKTNPALAASIIGTNEIQSRGVDSKSYADDAYWKGLLGSEAIHGQDAAYAGQKPIWDIAKQFGLVNGETTSAANTWASTMAPEAQAERSDARNLKEGVFGDPVANFVGQAMASYFGGPIGAGLYGTANNNGDIGAGLTSGLLTYAGGQLTGTGPGAAGGSWYSPSADFSQVGDAAALPTDQVSALNSPPEGFKYVDNGEGMLSLVPDIPEIPVVVTTAPPTSDLGSGLKIGSGDGLGLKTDLASIPDMGGGQGVTGTITGLGTAGTNGLITSAGGAGTGLLTDVAPGLATTTIPGAVVPDVPLLRPNLANSPNPISAQDKAINSVTGVADKIVKAVEDDPIKAAGLALTAAPIVAKVIDGTPKDDSAEAPAPYVRDQAIFDKYSAIDPNKTMGLLSGGFKGDSFGTPEGYDEQMKKQLDRIRSGLLYG